MARPRTFAEFIRQFPASQQKKLKEMRGILKKAAPRSIEGIKWGSPTFSYKRILFTYMAFKDHISLMPTPPIIKALKKDLTKYKTTAATIHFPYDKPLPKALILKVAKLRVRESKEKDVRWM